MVRTQNPFASLLQFFLVALMLLIGCQSTVSDTVQKTQPVYTVPSATITTNFAPDGRLWRLIPTEQHVYVDYSDDHGIHYSKPIQINKRKQNISAWPENPPAIEISQSGRINVLYYADDKQKSTSFYSYSDNNGQTFSTPTLVSDRAKTAMHYMDKMLVDDKDNLYLIWHDTRHDSHQHNHQHNQSSGILSLYYSFKTHTDNSQFNNHFLSSDVCSCCRTATTISSNGNPVILARMVYENNVRDHALIRMNADGSWLKPKRVTYDNWSVEACPEHGPAVAIDNNDRTHFTWFTLGDIRSGIFYAQTDNFGQTVSVPLTLGNFDHLPSHPDIIAFQNRVVIAWKEFDGDNTKLRIKESKDRGETWLDINPHLQSQSKNSHPELITNKTDIFLSWTSKDKGYTLTKI